MTQDEPRKIADRVSDETLATMSLMYGRHPLVGQVVEELLSLRGVIEQHNLCHDLHGKVNAEDFAKGCEAEQRRIYGCAPHADRIAELEAEIERLKRTAWTIEMIVDGFNKIAVEERDELKRENRRLSAEIERMQKKIDHKCKLLGE